MSKYKIEKYTYKKRTDIFIEKFNCTYNNTIKLISVLPFKNMMSIFDSEIDILSFAYKLDELNIQFFLSPKSHYSVTIATSKELTLKIIPKVFQYKIEGMFFANLIDSNIDASFLYCSNKTSPNNLINKQISDFTLGIIIPEHHIEISFNTHVNNAEEIMAILRNNFN